MSLWNNRGTSHVQLKYTGASLGAIHEMQLHDTVAILNMTEALLWVTEWGIGLNIISGLNISSLSLFYVSCAILCELL